MMRSSDAAGNNALYDSISEELTCIVCFERMVYPKSLKCFHIFCIACLKRSIGKNGKIKCPTCRKNTKVKNKDPAFLPTVFLVNRLSDILCNYERQMTEECAPKEIVGSVNSGVETSSKNSTPHFDVEDPLRSRRAIVAGSKNCGAEPAKDGLVKKYHERRCSLQHTPVQCTAENSLLRRHSEPLVTVNEREPHDENKNPLLDLQGHEVPACPKDSHVYKVEGRKVRYSLNEDIKLNFLKYCNDGVRCNSWADDVHAILSDRRGRVTDFSKLKVSDGSWLLLCKPKSEGPLRAIVKANEKPITSFDINVYSILTEPIEV